MDDLYIAIEQNELLIEKEYEGEVFENLDFHRIDMEDVAFSGCRFVKCDFSGCAFRGVTFAHCDFSNCNFNKGYFRNASLVECKGDGSDFSHSTFILTEIINGSYHYGNFSSTMWEDSWVSGSELCDSFFSDTRFKKIKFENVNFYRCDFFKTMLKGIDLSTCLVDGIMVSDTFRELKGLKINLEQAVVFAQLLGVKFV